MNTHVLDTSVAVAWYLEESFAAPARLWQQRLLAGKIVLVVPSLHYVEFANVLRTLVHRRELEAGLARNIYELHLEAPLERREPDERTLLDVALKYGATAYDAAYISLCLASDLTLITAERTTTAWVAKLGDRIELVR
jgi:predicted nucleic acid-binding protein